MILLFQKGFFAEPDDEAVKTMTRTGDRKELLRGPLYFTIVMNILGTVFFLSPAAAVTMGILGWGDGLAPYFGKKYGKHTYNFVTRKSVEGSIAFLVFGFLGAVLFSLIIFGELKLVFLLISLFASVLVEALSPGDLDNILIPLTCMIISIFF
jgi:dolichol kinase